MGQGLDQGRVDREKRIEEVGETDALGFGDEAEEGTIRVEGPRADGFGDFQRELVGTVENSGG